MEELPHFSHSQHPLKLYETLHEQNGETGTSRLCNGCRKPLDSKAGEPIFSCEECKFFLDKRCTQLPMEIKEHPLHPEHELKLFAEPHYLKDGSRCICDGCHQICDSFIYHCPMPFCQFDLHVTCAFPELKLDHPGHEHPLIFLQKLSIFSCDACGVRSEGQTYVCATCQIWIHFKCALLPRINYRLDHDHPLSLSYCVPIELRRYEIPCDYCFGEIPIQNWVYYCGPCRYMVHLDCLAKYRQPENGKSKFGYQRQDDDDDDDDRELELVQLPSRDFVEIIRHTLEKLEGMEISRVPETMKVSRCPHRTIQVNVQNIDGSSEDNEDITCNRCTEPISSWCCKCSQCNYFVHFTCAQLPSALKLSDRPKLVFPIYQNELEPKLVFPIYVWDVFNCGACNLDCNGYLYQSSYYTPREYPWDVKCALLPKKLMHKAHQHPLSHDLGQYAYFGSKCSCCGQEVSQMFFACSGCQFYLDFKCATLPATVDHRWDKHPLQLSIPPFSDRPGEFYCEVCEEEIHPRRWHHYCRECDQSFHPHCIPKVLYRNCTFGGTLELGSHPHPLKFIREGGYHSRCHSCRDLMFGKRVFECASCRFYVCLSCVTKAANSGKIIGPNRLSQ